MLPDPLHSAVMHSARGDQPCDNCPITTSRRAFLRDAATAAAAAIAAVTLGRPAWALAQSVAEIQPTASTAVGVRELAYALPPADSVRVDVANEVILARWKNRVFAFSLKCPHKGAPLEWRASEQRVFCPKHKARFTADGSHVSGRGSRDLDRHGIRQDANGIVVSLDRIYRRDRHPDEWSRAVVSL